jgi:hypothetical protein
VTSQTPSGGTKWQWKRLLQLPPNYLAYWDMLNLVACAIIYRLSLPLLYFFSSLEIAYFDFPPIFSDVLSSPSLFATRCLGYARPSPADLVPVKPADVEADPAFQAFLEAYLDALSTYQDVSVTRPYHQHWENVCDLAEAEDKALSSEGPLLDAVLDAVLHWKALKNEEERKRR